MKRTQCGLEVERRLRAVIDCFGQGNQGFLRWYENGCVLDDLSKSIQETREILRSNKRLKPLAVLAERLTNRN